jgi:hypothetical protein
MVHERRIQETGEQVTLRVSGQVRLGNLVMYDTVTGSHWLQETGRSIEGAREGQALRPMNPDEWNENVRWDEWKKQHPDTKVLVCSHCDKAGQ